MRNSVQWLAAAAMAALAPAAGASTGQFQITTAVSTNPAKYEIQSVSQANSLLGGAYPSTVTQSTAPIISFYDPQSANVWLSHFPYSKVPFPTNTSAVDQNFALKADGTLVIPKTDTYTFGVNSDDGFSLKIGSSILMQAGDRSASDSLAQMYLPQGSYPLELVYYQDLGQAEVELFAAEGGYTKFSDSPSSFHLVGDTSSGALQLAATAVPEPASLALRAMAAGAMLMRRRRIS